MGKKLSDNYVFSSDSMPSNILFSDESISKELPPFVMLTARRLESLRMIKAMIEDSMSEADSAALGELNHALECIKLAELYTQADYEAHIRVAQSNGNKL
jgi:hypothetical protein